MSGKLPTAAPGAKARTKIVDVKDVGFVQAAAIVRKIELTADLKDYASLRVNSYKLTAVGLRQKLAMVDLLQDNRARIKLWGAKPGRTEEMLCLARSMYQTTGHAIDTCLAHAEIIRSHLAEVGQNV